MKKNLSKAITTKLYPAKECIKNKRLSDYIYSIANLQCKVCLTSTKAEQFIKENNVKTCKMI